MLSLFRKKKNNLIPISYENYIDASGLKPDKNGNKSGVKSHIILYYNYNLSIYIKITKGKEKRK